MNYSNEEEKYALYTCLSWKPDYTLYLRKEKETNHDDVKDKKEALILHLHFGFDAVHRLCSLPQNQSRAALHSAPSMNFMKQTS